MTTDGLYAYRELKGYVHDRHVQRHQVVAAEHLLPRVHRAPDRAHVALRDNPATIVWHPITRTT